METTQPSIGPEIQAFIGACETLAGFAQYNGFTENEREIVMMHFLRTLERHIVPSPLPLADALRAATLSHAPCSTDPLQAHIHEAIFQQTGEFLGPSLFE
jgi:hypothetical protein